MALSKIRGTLYMLANIPDGQLPSAVQGTLTESPAEIRNQVLTALIENQLWLADGQAHGLYASSAQASSAAANMEKTAQSVTATSATRTRFLSYLCANQLSAASYPTDPRVIQSFQASLTIAAAKSAVVASLPTAQQQSQTAVSAALTAHVKALWASDNVQVFLVGFTPPA